MLVSLHPDIHIHPSLCDMIMVLEEGSGGIHTLQYKFFNEPGLPYPATVIRSSWSFSDICKKKKTIFGSWTQNK